MTPKEKAEELVDKYRNTIMSFLSDNMKDMNAKQCAMIAVDEIIKSRKDDYEFDDLRYASPSSCNYKHYVPHPMYSTYWQQVKQEIEKL